MNKYIIILFSIIFFSISCVKKTSSSPSSIAGVIDNSVYYYKTCESQYICKFQCDEGTDISSLLHQNVGAYCSTLKAATTTTIKSSFSDDIQTNIIDPIIKVNTLELLTVDNDVFQRFDRLFTRFANIENYSEKVAEEYRYHCYSNCRSAYIGVFPVIWKKITIANDTIYQHYSTKLLARLQWSLPQLNPDDPSKFKMTYKQAVRACYNYKFNKYSDWSLVSSKDLEEAIKLGLASEIFNITSKSFNSDDFAWTIEKNSKQLAPSYGDEPKDRTYDPNNLNYAICTRTYTPGE